MDKKELSDKLNKQLGTEFDWTKPLTKDNLTELSQMIGLLKDMLEGNDIGIRDVLDMSRGAIVKEVKSRSGNIVDKVLSGKGPILSIVIGHIEDKEEEAKEEAKKEG